MKHEESATLRNMASRPPTSKTGHEYGLRSWASMSTSDPQDTTSSRGPTRGNNETTSAASNQRCEEANESTQIVAISNVPCGPTALYDELLIRVHAAPNSGIGPTISPGRP